MAKQKILFIDDQINSLMQIYVEELSKQYNISSVANSSEGLRIYQQYHTLFDLVILDMMMPPGELFKQFDTYAGIRTGLYLCKEILTINPQQNIILFSNIVQSRPDAPSAQDYAEIITANSNVHCLNKIDYNPSDLVDFIETLIRKEI